MSKQSESNLLAAEKIAALLAVRDVPVVVIGAIALAAHGYIRFTEDIDLGANVSLPKMRELTELLKSEGLEAELSEPEGNDPLGGVINISGSFGLVQVVSFEERFPAVIRDALQGEEINLKPGSLLRITPIPQLVALKLYAGGWSSKADIIELLRRNPEVDLNQLRETCEKYRLPGLEGILEELEQGQSPES